MKLPRGITRNVFVLGIVSLFNDIASEMLYPIIPIFLTAVLGAPVAVVGLIEGLAEATANLLKVFSGVFSDAFRKRKPFVIAGYSLSTIAKPILATAFSWPMVLFARIVDRFGKGVRTTARDALIADSSLPEHRGKAFGFHRSMDTTGAVIGPLLLLLFLSKNLSYRQIFLIAAIPSVIGVALLVIFVKEKAAQGQKRQRIDFSMKGLGKPFAMFLFVYAVFSFGNSSDAFLILRAKSLGFSIVEVVLAYVLYNVTYAVSSAPAGAMSDKLNKKHIIGIGFLIFSFVYGGMALLGASAIWLLFIIYGFYIGLTDGVGKAYITTIVPKERRGAALGIFFALTGILALFASVIAGILWTKVSPAAPFIYGSALSLVAAAMLFIIPGSAGLVAQKSREA